MSTYRISPNLRMLILTIAAALALGLGCDPVTAEPAAEGVRVGHDKAAVTVSIDGRPVAEYRFAEVPFKPYVKQLCSPSGVQVLRDAPHDHLHHHALMFAVGVDGVDFWAETPVNGKQVHRSFGPVKPSSQDGRSTAEWTEELDWLKPDKTPLLVEKRTLTVESNHDPAATLLTWRSELSPAAGKESVTLGGSHYFGLGVRFVESMDKGGRFFNSGKKEGEIVRGDERLTPAKWCAFTAAAGPQGDKKVTVAVFDHPQNPRHPARMFTMSQPFAYLSATLNLWKEPLKVTAGKPLDLKYAVAVWDGEIDDARIGRVYEKWIAAPAAKPAK
jgi:hypothetical protein